MQLIAVGPNGNKHAEIGRSWHAYSYSQLIPVGPNRNEHAEKEILASLFIFATTVGNEDAEIERSWHAYSYSPLNGNEFWSVSASSFPFGTNRNRHAKISISASSFLFE